MLKKLFIFLCLSTLTVFCAKDGDKKTEPPEDGGTQNIDDNEPLSCTAIGCEDQLSVEFKDLKGETYVLVLDIEGKTSSITCDKPDEGVMENISDTSMVHCDKKGFHLMQKVTSLDVKISAIDNSWTFEKTLTPEFKTLYPNGEQCGPACEQATLKLSLANCINQDQCGDGFICSDECLQNPSCVDSDACTEECWGRCLVETSTTSSITK